ncbi:MAG: hypothetical protein JF570_06820 [Caulobacter sp.]|nr:hypothetical protein [Caulobacter sp.]
MSEIMSEDGKHFWRDAILGVIVLAVVVPIGYLSFDRIANKTPRVTGPHVVQGMFTVHTTATDSSGAYLFQAEDGRDYAFYCGPITQGRGLGLNTCLAYAGGAPAPDLGGRPVEARYLAAQYPPTWIGATTPHLILLSVRDGVVFRNSVWLKATGP